jgi:hypothetical protein
MRSLNGVTSLRKLVLVGPISLNIELDAESLHENGYEDVQRSATAYLNKLTSGHGESFNQAWTFNELSDKAVLFSPPGFENRHLLPMAFLRFDSNEVTTKVGEILRAIAGSEWEVHSCSLNFFTFGFATIKLELQNQTKDSLIGQTEIAEEFSHGLAEHLSEPINPVLRAYENGLRSVLSQWVVPTLTSKERHAGLLWLQRIIIWDVDDVSRFTGEAKSAVPNVHEILEYRDCLVVPAVDTSILCLRANDTEPEDWIVRIFQFEAAVSASLLQMDGWLFDELNHVVLASRTCGSAEAAAIVRAAQASFERVELHRAKIDSTVAFLGSASVAVWEARSRVSGLPQLDAALTRKLELLQRLSQARYTAAELAQSRRLNRLALIFTLFSAASSGTALVDFAYGGKWLSPNVSRLFVLTAMLLAICVATLLAIREVRMKRD